MATTYKLYYFPVKALGELPRQLFAAANKVFEDIRIQPKDWPQFKADHDKTLFSQVPILVVKEGENEFKIAQSNTIARYLARKFDLAGKSEIEQIRVEMVLDYVQEFHAFFRMIRMANLGRDEAYGANKTISPEEAVEKQKLRTEQLIACLPNYLRFLNKMLHDQNTQFLAGNELTAADIALSVMIDRYEKYLVNGLVEFPRLKEINQTVNDLPGIKTYKEKRPPSSFEGTLE